MKIKNVFVLAMFLLSVLAFGGIASAALDVTIDSVEVNDVEVEDAFGEVIPGLEKADEVEVRVEFVADSRLDDVQVEAQLRGYDHSDLIEDITDAFDVNANRTYVKTLKLDLKERMDVDERYQLKVLISDRYDHVIETYTLDVASTEHSVVIRDVILSPSNGVKAGRALLATVRLQNRGTSEEEDVKVTFSIPELGVAASDYIDELSEDGDDDDSKSTEELYVRIPECASSGTYEAIVEVEYDDGDEVVKEKMAVEVLADDACEAASSEEATVEGKTMINFGADAQEIVKGAGGVIYPVTITNTGKASKTYVISVTGGDWGAFRVSPTNVVTVAGDETKTVYIYASANEDAVAGTQVFGVEIKSGDKTVDSVTLKANVADGNTSRFGSLKGLLEVGLIVLVVILVILGLVIGFKKLKEDDEDKEEGQNYY